MSAQRTPGPWRFVNADRSVKDADGFDVAVVLSPNPRNDGPLISEAPNLLKAAKEFIAHLERVGIPNDDEPFVDALIAAVSRATTPT